MIEQGFYRYVMPFIESNMYLRMEGDRALVIDPSKSDALEERLIDAHVTHVTILLTHEHFDHISGINWLRQKFPSRVICQEKCALSMAKASNNRPLIFLPLMKAETEREAARIRAFYDSFPLEEIHAETIFQDSYEFLWQGHSVHIRSCPGHSPGSCVIGFEDTIAFTGDYMIPDTPVILRFPGGSKKDYHEKTLPYLLGIGKDTAIMPGHGMPCFRRDLELVDGIFVRAKKENVRGEGHIVFA